MHQAAQPHRDPLRPAEGAGWSDWSLSAAAVLLVIGLSGSLERIMARVPGGIASGMMVGILLPFGMAVLRTSGDATPARPVLVVNSLVSLAVACAGGITIAIAAITAAISTNPGGVTAADGHREASGMTFLGLGAAFRGISP